VEYTQKLLEEIGLEGRRVQMINLSAAMGGQFAWSAAELTEEVRQMGPNRLKQNGHQQPPATNNQPVDASPGEC
jgi:coenzyme F420-reducing hydrogenase delta subunit